MSYFSSEGIEASGELRIVPGGALARLPIAEGITVAPVLGEALNINVVVLEAGATAEVHAHAEEQIGYVVSGEAEFTDGERTWMLGPGDCYHAPPGAPHGARAPGGPCVIIDAFSPPRAGIREMLEER